MRRFYIIYGIYIVLISVFVLCGIGNAENKRVMTVPDIYYVDADMLRLVSVSTPCEGENAQEQAQCVIEKLISGKDKNKKIKRMIPAIKNCMNVHVRGNTAYVDIKESAMEYFPDGKIAEELVVYQIVNSLTSIDGIVKVKFTFDGKEERFFKGFIDMRETFIPDYYV